MILHTIIQKLITPVVILVTVGMLTVAVSSAQQSSGDYAQFERVVNSMKTWKKYGYKSKMNGLMPTGQYAVQETKVYIDLPQQLYYYEDKAQILLVNRQHIMQIDHRTKQFKIFKRSEYQKIYGGRVNNIQSLFKEDLIKSSLDSVLVKNKQVTMQKSSTGAKIFRTVKKDDLLSVVLELETQPTTDMIHTMNYSIFDLEDNSSLLTCNVYDYVTDFSADVFSTQRFFTEKGSGDYTLLMYKNYKLLTQVK